MDIQNTSYILSICSLIFYSIVYLPQFVLIYKTKSSDGVSIWTLLLWTQADILSLIGTIILRMPTSIIIIGWYHYSIGTLMLLYVLYYKKRNEKGDEIMTFRLECLSTLLFLIINTSICLCLNLLISTSYDEIGAILGWITMVVYTVGRIPQIKMNYDNKSTGNLSILMYIFTIIGNSLYIGVITIDPMYIEPNIPWIVNGIVSILLDIIVILQYIFY